MRPRVLWVVECHEAGVWTPMADWYASRQRAVERLGQWRYTNERHRLGQLYRVVPYVPRDTQTRKAKPRYPNAPSLKSVASIAEDYDLTPSQVRRAVMWWRRAYGWRCVSKRKGE